MNTDIASDVPAFMAHQPKGVLEPVELNVECAFNGYPWRLQPEIEFRMLDIVPPLEIDNS